MKILKNKMHFFYSILFMLVYDKLCFIWVVYINCFKPKYKIIKDKTYANIKVY